MAVMRVARQLGDEGGCHGEGGEERHRLDPIAALDGAERHVDDEPDRAERVQQRHRRGLPSSSRMRGSSSMRDDAHRLNDAVPHRRHGPRCRARHGRRRSSRRSSPRHRSWSSPAAPGPWRAPPFRACPGSCRRARARRRRVIAARRQTAKIDDDPAFFGRQQAEIRRARAARRERDAVAHGDRREALHDLASLVGPHDGLDAERGAPVELRRSSLRWSTGESQELSCIKRTMSSLDERTERSPSAAAVRGSGRGFSCPWLPTCVSGRCARSAAASAGGDLLARLGVERHVAARSGRRHHSRGAAAPS